MILFRPLLTQIKHSLRISKGNLGKIVQASIVFFLILMLAVMIFGFMSWTLGNLLSEKSFVSVSAELIFIFCFNLFLPMIFFTNLSSFIGNFYNSEDLELILSSPMSKFKFFLQRTLLTSFESSWMTLFSLMPFILSVYVNYEVSWLVFFVLPITLMIFILVPASFASFVGILWALLIPNIPPIFILLLIAMACLYLLKNVILLVNVYVGGQDIVDFSYLNVIFSKIESFGLYWSPATWAAKTLAPFFRHKTESSYANLDLPSSSVHDYVSVFYGYLASISSIALVLSLSYLLFLHFYPTSLSIMWGRKRKVLYSFGPILNNIFQYLFKKFPKDKIYFTMIKKEILELLRDTTQVVQFLFLGSFFAIYVYTLQFQQSFQVLIGASDNLLLKRIIFLLNFSIETFMLVALSLRLTFPSISREGRSAWVYQVSPIRPKIIIISKLFVLSAPIILMMSVLSFFSHYINTNDLFSSLLKSIYIITVCLSISSLSMYIGSSFAYFTWESRSQLIASLGSITFMFFGLIFSFFVISLSFPLNPLVDSYAIASRPSVLVYWLFIVLVNIFFTKFFLNKATKHLTLKLKEVII